jgi:signal transduction histidine kinase
MRRTLQALADFFAKRWPHLNAESDFQRKIVSRLCMVERNIMLPIKLGLILVVLRFLFFSAEVYPSPHSRAVALDTVRFFFVIYLLITVGCSIMIAGIRTLPLWYVELVVLIAAILDIILLSALTMITGGLNSPLFWFYLLLSMRNSLSIYSPTTQITVNSLTILAYLFAGLTDIRIAQIEGESIIANTDSLALRLVILGAMTLFSYYFQTLFDKLRRAEGDAREFQIRQEQLQATGRLAAEIAHQLKNPLGIINNAAFTLQRTVKEGKTITQQIHLIREEVHRSDRILTDLMGFAQLAEGTVQPLHLASELDEAIEQVFPEALRGEVTIKRQYDTALPSVMMQKGHFSEIIVNILHNARDAMQGKGEISIKARLAEGFAVNIALSDTGPGMSQELLDQVFEAYFTTKEKGTGLGLAIVKHNVEIYGGKLMVESQLGAGTTFTIQLPARALIKLRKARE